jgi:diguanylate cyclase (GGDEF)-like protein
MSVRIFALSDGAAPLSETADLLRARGLKVYATPHPPEFERRLKTLGGGAVLLPARLVHGRVARALAERRAGPEPRPLVVMLREEGETPPDGADAAPSSPLEAVAFLHDALYRREPGATPPPPPTKLEPSSPLGSASIVGAVDVSPEEPRREERGDARWLRLAENARLLAELEADVDRLLDAALDAYLEAAGATCGSFLASPEEGVLEVVRRTGYADEDQPAAVEAAAVEAARRVVPLQDRAGADYVLACPVTEGRRVLGVLAAARGTEPEPEDRAAAALAARHAAACYVNARRLEEFRKMAVVDPLTGLFNRRFFERQLRVEIERARRHRRHLSLAIIDVDGFKRFNGLNGYDVGDQVIRETAEVLKGNFREIDVVTRWGGDEFAVILPETHAATPSDAARGRSAHFVDRVRKAVETHRFRACPNGRVTISAGVAAFPGDAADAKGLFQSANQALLEAKRSGHNRVIVVGPDGRPATASV